MAGTRNGLIAEGAKSATRAQRAGTKSSGIYRDQALGLSQRGQLGEAESLLREGLRLWPDDLDLFNELGLTIMRQGRAAEADEVFETAIRIRPDDYRLLMNRGVSLYEQRRFDEACELCQEAIRIRPDAFDAHMNIGVMLSEQGKFDEAAGWLDRANRLRPDVPDIYLNRGMNFFRRGRPDEAINDYERGLRLSPEFARLRRNLAYALLCLGDYQRGWQEHEWRLKCHDYPGRRVSRPLWNGEPFRGRTILLHHEQGFGDTLQLIRLAPLVKARGGNVILWCPPRLLRIAARCEGIDLAFDGTSYHPDCQLHAPLYSLPAILGITLATLPPRVPYLATDPVLVEHWRSEVARAIATESGTRPFMIGVAWQGNPSHSTDRWRSFPLAQLAPIAAIPGVRLINLQTDHGLEQVAPLAGRVPITELNGRRVNDFAETAAIMTQLDLVITPDSALAHLAGGLGLPVWVALSSVGEWRWLDGRDDSPWYPTMRLFRQTRFGDWAGVFGRIADALKRLVGDGP